MLSPQYEQRVRWLQEEISRLEREHDAANVARTKARTVLKEAVRDVRWRDRYRWSSWFNGGSLAYDKIRPLRDEVRKQSRLISQTRRRADARQKDLTDAVTTGLKEDRKYSTHSSDMDRAEQVGQACGRVLEAIKTARKSISKARSSTSRDVAAVDRTALRLSKAVEDIRGQVRELRRTAKSYGTISNNLVNQLSMTFSSGNTDRSARNTELRNAGRALDRVGTKVTRIQRTARKRAKSAERDLRQRVDAEVKRIKDRYR
jgi:hypothetical protein